MNETVEYRVAEGAIADDVMPVLDGDLTGNEGRAATVAVFENIEKVTALGIVRGAIPKSSTTMSWVRSRRFRTLE